MLFSLFLTLTTSVFFQSVATISIAAIDDFVIIGVRVKNRVNAILIVLDPLIEDVSDSDH